MAGISAYRGPRLGLERHEPFLTNRGQTTAPSQMPPLSPKRLPLTAKNVLHFELLVA